MRHLVIGQRQKAPNFSAFHWSPHGCLITIGQHIVTMRVVHLPKRTEKRLITDSDQSRANHQLIQLCTVRTAWSEVCGPCIAAKAGYITFVDIRGLDLLLRKTVAKNLKKKRKKKKKKKHNTYD